MLEVYHDKEAEVKTRFAPSPRERRGRRRGRIRSGRGVPSAPTGTPGDDRSNVPNRETELAARVISKPRLVTVTGKRDTGVIIVARSIGQFVVRNYFGFFYKCAYSVMGMFKWLRKDFVQWDRSRRNLSSPERRGINNEAYRSALQAFLDRRRDHVGGSEGSDSPKLSPTSDRVQDHEIFFKNTKNEDREIDPAPGVPHVEASELFEVGWVAGTEDRYLELISAEWHHTRTALRRSSHPECFSAVKADLEVLTEIRHPNTLLLMGTTRTDEHGVVAIFESVDCTLYNYVHEQGERVSVQGAARCAGQLADALRHAHARGFTHGALSSHCVFLAASGTAKLGGWELAVRENESKPYRPWEQRLRSEIFRWQAPEMFYGDAPSKACDVYALALLIWEMCTGQVPWGGLNEIEVERQYIHWERGIPTDTYNFPPLLGNLLEAGLQLDAGKRKLDMSRTHRFLRRLELRYEEDDPIYVDRHPNNNNPRVKTFNAPVIATSPLIKSPAETPRRESKEIGKKLFSPDKVAADVEIYSNNYNESFVNNEKVGSATEFKARKNTNVYLESRRNNCGQVFCTKGEKVSDYRDNNIKTDEPVNFDGKRQRRSVNKTVNDIEEKMKGNKKNLVAYESSFSETSTATETANSSSDESGSEAKTDIKKLKELLATKRSNFFYGNNSPENIERTEVPDVTRSCPQSRERILREARGKSCEPCKPASHKINLEPQLCKSPTEYNPTLIKPASHQNQRVSNLSLDMKQAILHPQTLHSSSSSFFETSLWRKEKEICLSKMRKENPDDDQQLFNMDKTTISQTSRSPNNDSTYILNHTATEKKEASDFQADSAFTTGTNITQDNTTPTSPLQAVKEALDRATNIIRSVTPNTDESVKLSPVESLDTSDIALDDSGVKESIFESLNRSKLGGSRSDEEIKSIERSEIDERDSLLVIGKPKERFAEDKEKSKCVSFGQTIDHLRTPRTSNIDESLVQRLHDFTCNDQPDYANDSLNGLAERSLVSTAMIFFSNKSQDKGCKSCQHRNLLARRRSLPAGFPQIRSTSASPLGRLPIRRGEVPDSTVEDLYIDDEFGDNLNVNMVLLENEDEPDDQDLLLSLLQTSDV